MFDRRWALRLGVLGALIIVASIPIAVTGSFKVLKTTFNSPIDWVPSDFPERIEWASFSERFQLGETIFITWPGATLDNPNLKIVADAIEKAEPKTVLSATAGSEIYEDLLSGPWAITESEAASRLRGSVVGPDQQQSLVVVNLSAEGTLDRVALVNRLKELTSATAEVPISEIREIGIPVEGAVIDMSAAASIENYAIPSAIIAILICWFCLRSIWLTVAISSVAMIGQGLALASVWLTGQPMNAILIVLPPLVFVLTVSSGIHLSNYFLEIVYAEPVDKLQSHQWELVSQALKAGIVPCLLATGTTIVGLGSLVIVPIVPVRHFGILAAISIGLTMLLLLMVLPLTMQLTIKSFLKVRTKANDKQPTDSHVRLRTFRALISRLLDRFYHLPIKHPVAVVILVGLFASIFVVGLRNIETSVAVSNLFSPDHPMRQEYHWFEQNIGPAVGGELQVRFPDLQNSDPVERLRLSNSLHVAVAQQPDVSGVLSAGVFLPKPPRSTGFTTRMRRTAIAAQIENLAADSPLVKAGLLAKDGNGEYWRISYRVPLESDIGYASRLEEIGNAVREVVAESGINAEVTSTGGVMLIEAAQVNLLTGLLKSFITAFAVVAVVMMILLRSVLGGCLAMLPNALPTVVTFGVLGLSRTPLDIGAVMTASLALGIAVDDTVHLLSRFSSFRLRGNEPAEAALAALRQCGPAMAQTTLVCGVSLLVYGLSDFLPTRRFSLLMVCLLGTAIVGDLLLLPALLASKLGEYFARPVLVSEEPLLESDHQ